jgi:hypothetical protein
MSTKVARGTANMVRQSPGARSSELMVEAVCDVLEGRA